MKPICEVIAVQMLPTLRALIAKELTENYGLNQQEAAEKLGLTQPAISQYLRELRGYKIKLLTKDKEVYLKISNICKQLANDELSYDQLVIEFCNVCKMMRKKGLICKLHKAASSKLKECNICMER